MPPTDLRVRAPAPTLPALFMGFFGIGIVGFGGVLPWLRRMMVEQREWLTTEEFNDLLALCQFLPGPNVVNMAVATGARFGGLVGSVTCLLGLLIAPVSIIILLGGLYDAYGGIPIVARAIGGVAAAASGLVVATAVKIAVPLAGDWLRITIALASFTAVGLLRLPLLPAMLTLAPVSVWLCLRHSKRSSSSLT